MTKRRKRKDEGRKRRRGGMTADTPPQKGERGRVILSSRSSAIAELRFQFRSLAGSARPDSASFNVPVPFRGPVLLASFNGTLCIHSAATSRP